MRIRSRQQGGSRIDVLSERRSVEVYAGHGRTEDGRRCALALPKGSGVGIRVAGGFLEHDVDVEIDVAVRGAGAARRIVNHPVRV